MTLKEKRKEQKRKKIAALLEISDLNKKDRETTMTPSYTEASSEEPQQKKMKLTGPSQEDISEDNSKPKYSEKELEELRKLLKQRNREKKKTPYLSLKEPTGFQAELNVSPTDRVPIFFSDIQHFVLFSTLAQNSPFIPRWCQLDKCGHLTAVQILFIEGAGISDYLQCEESLTSLSKSNFPFHLEVVMPSAYGGNLIEEFCAIPLSRNQGNNIIQAYGSLEKAVNSSCEVFKVLRAFFPVNENNPSESSSERSSLKNGNKNVSDKKSGNEAPSQLPVPETLPQTDKFPRTHLLLSAWQMIEEGYPIPLNAALKEKFKDFVATKPIYKEVNNFSPMYAVDCEMCTTSIGKSECTRVSIVNEKLETVLDTLVLPPNKITNYLTRYSGITAAMMKNVTTRLEDVQKFIQENLESDAILVGQSLNFDLVALQMMHPYCIDTSVIFNVTGDRYRKSKLRYLSEHFLKESIQTGNQGHCSVEDSSASLKLVQLKLSKSLEFGDQVLSVHGMNKHKNSETKEKVDLSGYATSLFSYATRMGKHASILAGPEIVEKYMDYLNPRIASYEQVNDDGSCKTIAKDETSDTGRVTCVISASNQSVVDGASSKVFDNFLTIGHIKLTENESAALASAEEKTVTKLNNWISHMQKSALLNSLSIVVLCGRERSSNGVCFINLHKKKFERIQYKPGDSLK